jgi:XTP/dITP diphosphohydrolase
MEQNNKTIILATRNQGKIRELVPYFARIGWTLQGLPADAPLIIEDGLTFAENAHKKAETIARMYGMAALADDSGLEVDALGGRPGVYSARYAGENASDEMNNRKLLQEMVDVPVELRTARFVCVLALSIPGKRTLFFRGECEGRILREMRGTGGFGYDPLFYLPHLDKSMAELTVEQKNQISHRAQAMRKLTDYLVTLTPSR